MQILDIKVMRGPNIWSNYRYRLIVMKLDIGFLENMPTNKIENFSERIEHLMPSLYHHRCSENSAGGFFYRVKKGTWMGHVVEHIALELQTLAGMECGYGRTRGTGKVGVYNVVFSYRVENAGVYAGKAAIRIAEALIKDEDYNIEEDIAALRRIKDREDLGPSTSAIVEEAESRRIPCIRLNKNSLVMLGYGVNQKRIQTTICSTTSSIAVDIACDKEETKALLESASIPVPRGLIIYDEEGLDSAISKLGFPLVIKPVNGNHGRGITTKINDREKALEALAIAQKVSSNVIVERFIQGFDFRLLLVNYKLVAAAKRTPAMVIGDGTSTVQQLVDFVNEDVRRGEGHSRELSRIVVDEVTENILTEKGITLDSVLEENEILYLKDTANISTGGTATDVTDFVHPENIHLMERVAKIIGLDICGIDVMAQNLSTPLVENRGAILEVNAAPGLRMHLKPTYGFPRNVAAPIIDMLFPKGAPFTIPIVAITGTNGKTTTTRLIAHIMGSVGHKVGYTSTDGVFIQNQMIEKGDCTGPVSAQLVLKDPSVDFAVLECARGGILRSGLGFRYADIGIITNVADDHLGLEDINTIEEMAEVKAVVAESVKNDGYAILNADDATTLKINKSLKCNIAYFSLNENNEKIKEHCAEGGLAAIFENGFLTICKGRWKLRIEEVEKVPLTFGGKAPFMIQNILPAILSAYIRNVKVDHIRKALHTFIPSPEVSPGRMNLFKFRHFDVLVDYAHNTHGLNALSKFLANIQGRHKVGVIAAVGDRRDLDLINIGRIAAKTFDEIIIRQDKDLRGRTEEEIVALIKKGILEVSSEIPFKVISNEFDSINFVIHSAKKNSFIVICSDIVADAINTVNKLKLEDEMNGQRENIYSWVNSDNIAFIRY